MLSDDRRTCTPGGKGKPGRRGVIGILPWEQHSDTVLAIGVIGISNSGYLRTGLTDMTGRNNGGIEFFVTILSGGHHLERQCRGDILADRAILQVSLIDDVFFNT